ncbi:MAG TPA: hypothetical protein VH479_22005 [Acidimicrobiales bacterium]
MTPAQYLAGAVALGIALASLGLVAGRLRQALLPGYRGATGHLASVILGLALLVCVLQTAGSVGELRRGVVVVAVPAVALLVAAAAPRLGRRAGPADTGREPRPTARGRTRAPVVVALVLAALVVAQWSVHTSAAMERGMSDLDSLRYHGPFAARFVQQHSVTGLQRTSAENQETYFPGNAEMLDAYGILLFGSDVLTPVRNLGWLALALLAGWCGGARFGHGPAALAGVAAVCSTPLLATIEPGSAKNDVAALALVLAAAALALHALPDPPARGPRLAGLALAGAAGGLAAGTKLTVLGPLAALGAGAWLLSGPGHRRRAALCLAVPALATGALWYVRNLVHTGTPLPWFRIDLGFVTLAGPPMPFDERFAHSVAHYSGSVGFWTQTALPGLLHSFGALGPLLVAGGAGAAVTATKGRSRPARLAGAVALAGMVAYLFTPWGAGGPEGDPRLFAADLRFLAPALGLAAIAAAGSRLAPAALAGAAVLVSVDLAQSAGGGSSLVATVVLAAALCGAVVAAGRARAWPARLPAGALAAAVAVVGVGVGGWPVQRDYLDDRYAGNQLGHGIELPMFRHISGARVAVGGFADDYQLYGLGLSNQVQFNGVTGPDGSYRRAATCEEWLTGLQAGGYDYVVVSVSPAAHHVTPPPEEEWTEADPSAYEVERSGLTTVFRLVGRPDPASCGAPRLA